MPRKSIGAGTLESPLPAVMVTCGDIEGKRNIITVAWTGIINSEPPMCYVSVRRERFSHDAVFNSNGSSKKRNSDGPDEDRG